jgi:hypothetical protein
LHDCEAFIRGSYDHFTEEQCYMTGAMKE